MDSLCVCADPFHWHIGAKCETGLVLCRTALWDCSGMLSDFLLTNKRLRRKLGHNFVPANMIIK